MKPNNAILRVPEFHEVVLKGDDYISFGCCGNELFTIVQDHTDASLHHVIVTDVGYICSVENSAGMIDEEPEVIQNYLINTQGEEVQVFSFDDMSTIEKNKLLPLCVNKQNGVIFYVR